MRLSNHWKLTMAGLAIIGSLAASAEWCNNSKVWDGGQIVDADGNVWRPPLNAAAFARCGYVDVATITNTTQVVTTNYPDNYQSKLSAVTNYIALVVRANVYGMTMDNARAKLKSDADTAATQADSDAAQSLSIDLLSQYVGLIGLGIDPFNARAAITPIVATNNISMVTPIKP